uniref:hypothetical protein n=1 Tax=Pannonibacter phragmitetus TaxID=121719 RepID=UPI000B963341|nr:hypothetical protein [Pannonibacter phragmitetus]
MAALCWHEALDESFDSPARAAALVQGLDRHSFISPAPGIVSAAVPDSGMEPARLRLAMTALVVWLLAERSGTPGSLSGEHELLRIALLLCDSSKDAIAGAFRDREALGSLLQQLAERI